MSLLQKEAGYIEGQIEVHLPPHFFTSWFLYFSGQAYYFLPHSAQQEDHMSGQADCSSAQGDEHAALSGEGSKQIEPASSGESVQSNGEKDTKKTRFTLLTTGHFGMRRLRDDGNADGRHWVRFWRESKISWNRDDPAPTKAEDKELGKLLKTVQQHHVQLGERFACRLPSGEQEPAVRA